MQSNSLYFSIFLVLRTQKSDKYESGEPPYRYLYYIGENAE